MNPPEKNDDLALKETLVQFMEAVAESFSIMSMTPIMHEGSTIIEITYHHKIPSSVHSLPLSLNNLTEEITSHTNKQSDSIALINGWSFVQAQRCCMHGEQHITLTEKEAALLQLLANVSSGVKRDVLERCIWNMHGDAESHTLDSHLYRLRHKLAPIYGDNEPVSHDQGRYILFRG